MHLISSVKQCALDPYHRYKQAVFLPINPQATLYSIRRSSSLLKAQKKSLMTFERQLIKFPLAVFLHSTTFFTV